MPSNNAGERLYCLIRGSVRRLTHARPVSRAATHIAVIGLVACASAFGYAATRPAAGADLDTASLLPFDLVSRVRGADAAAVTSANPRSSSSRIPIAPTRCCRARVLRATPTPPLPTPVAPPPPAPDPPAVGGVAAAPLPPVVPQDIVGTGVLGWPVASGTITPVLQLVAPGASTSRLRTARTVIASDGGVVTWAGWQNNGGGLVIAIDHGNGIITVYNHLGTVLVGPGQAVGKGQGIAAVGCTGVCTGPHVHFEVIVGGVIVNPLRYL